MQEGAVTFGMPVGMPMNEGQNLEGNNQIVEEDDEDNGEGDGEDMEGDQEDAFNQLTAEQ